MKNFALTILLALFFVNSTLAQPSADSLKNTSFEFGKSSLQFGLGSYFTIGSYKGTIFSGKYHFSNKVALRTGISLTAYNDDQNINSEYRDNDSLFSSINSERNDVQLSFESLVLYYLNPQAEIKFYFGLGPYFSYSYDERVSDEGINSTPFRKVTLDKTIAFGLSTAYGIEWFFKKDMSLIADYGFKVRYFERKRQIEDLFTEKTTKNTGYSFGQNYVKAGISIYF